MTFEEVKQMEVLCREAATQQQIFGYTDSRRAHDKKHSKKQTRTYKKKKARPRGR